jgi:gliding motility-associated-like protein
MPGADAGDHPPICKGESVTINSVTGAGNILWTPGNFTTQSITVTPPITTTYTLFVSDAIGCSGTDTITIVVNELPVASFANNSPVCLNVPIDFTDGSAVPSGNVTNWNWDFGNGQTSTAQNPSHLYTSAGSFNVRLIVTTDGGCEDSVFNLAVVNPLPVADAGLDDDMCPGFNATLTGSGGNTYLWNPGGLTTSSITLSPANTTDYTLTVTDGNGCQNTDIATIIVNPVPVANAGVDQSICEGESTTLFANGGDFYLWNPGNINTQAYNITPNVSGTYDVLVTNTFGCESLDQVYVQVNPIPTAAFASTGAICEDNPVTFNDLSNVAAGSILAWNWDFGNNVSSSNQNPTIPYYNPGVYNVTLVIYSDNGCSDTANYVQTIWARPQAAFLHTDVCDGNLIDFTNTSSISDASALNYNWDLGDLTTSTNANLSHQYATYGSYSATLVVTSVNGCVDNTNSLVNVFPLPSASMNFNYACEDNPASFFDASSIPLGMISTWFWKFGDNSASTETNPDHTYSSPGYYDIDLLITSDHGCQDSTDGIIRVAPKPIVDFTTEDECLGYEISFTDSSQAITGPIVQYQWDLGDGNTSTDQNPVHTYGAPGWYQVGLTATTDSGCATTLIRPNALQIYPLPVPQFTNNSVSANDIYPLVNFFNETGSPGIYYWSFGDGDTAMEYSPTHLYPDVGFYDVQLITIDLNGCIDSILHRIEIKPTSNIYIPNAFTPNGDLTNDYFKVYSYNVVAMQLQIYDRWGIKIYESNDFNGIWDGKVDGNPAQSDTYVYRVSTIDVNEKREVFIGHVSIVR